MKGKFLAWLLLIIISSLALTNCSFKLEHDQGAADLSRSILQEHETDHGTQEMLINLYSQVIFQATHAII
jgi:hypothetical protein